MPGFSGGPVPFFASAHCSPDSEDLLRIRPLGVAALACDVGVEMMVAPVAAAVMTILGGRERIERREGKN